MKMFEDNSSRNLVRIIKETRVDITSCDRGSVSVVAQTPRLLLRPVCDDDIAFYHTSLWGSAEVMNKFGDGLARTDKDGYESYAAWRIRDADNSFMKRWEKGNPYSGFTIELLDNFQPIGHIVIGGGELAYLLIPAAWNQKYATEATVALTHVVLPRLINQGYLPTCGNDVAQHIEATVRADHIPSQRVLENNGFVTSGEIDCKLFGSRICERLVYKATVLSLCTRYHTIIDSLFEANSYCNNMICK